jgi:hypothetical protein
VGLAPPSPLGLASPSLGLASPSLGLASPSLASLAPASLASSPLALLVIGLIIQRLAASKRRGRDRQGVRSDGAGLRQPCGVAQ